MAVDKNKIVAEATRFAQKGQYDKAIKAYERILAEDKKEVRTLLKIGELQQKKGDSPAAAATFNQVAEIYGEQGFFLKAVAVYKQIAKLTPDDVRVNEKLAGLYQQLGLLNDATNQLQAVATAFEKAGDQGRHLDVLRRLLDLDPENVLTCQRLGDLYAKANRGAEALELYHRAAAHLKENKRGDEYVKLAERIFQLTPDDLKLAKELAQEYLARGETKKALGKLQVCHGTDKQDVDTLRLMAQAFRDLGQVSKTIAVYRALARVYAERGRREEAAVTWRMVQELLPDDPEAREEVAASGTAQRSPGVPVAPAAPQPSVVVPPSPDAAPGRPVAPRPAEVRGAPPKVMRPATEAQGAPQSPLERILTETDVYLKYGLHQKALDHVEKLLATDPENPDALERIRDIRETLGDQKGAAAAAGRAVKALLERGEEGRIAHATERLRQLDPSQAPAEAPAPPGEEFPLPDEEPPAAVLAAVPEEDRPEPAPVADEAVSRRRRSRSGRAGGARPGRPARRRRAEGGDRAGGAGARPGRRVADRHRRLPRHARRARRRLALSRRRHRDGDRRRGSRAGAGDHPGAGRCPPARRSTAGRPSAGSGDRRGRARGRRGGRTPHAPSARAGPPAHPGALLGAARRRDGGGRVLRAARAPRRGAPRHPGARVRPIQATPTWSRPWPGSSNWPRSRPWGPRRPSARSQPQPSRSRTRRRPAGGLGRDRYGSTGTTGIFDLGAELSAELGPELTPTPTGEFQYSVADVFDQFKRGLEKTVRPDDSATKYDLGIAFQEMGMLDEALEQFRSALAGGDRRREVEILNMIGVCLGLKGRHGEAIEAYQQALDSEFLTDEAAKALHFELGAAHEALGEPDAGARVLPEGRPGRSRLPGRGGAGLPARPAARRRAGFRGQAGPGREEGAKAVERSWRTSRGR